MKNKKLYLNLLYSLVQGGYWMYYLSALSYASKVLEDRGYGLAIVGLILAVGGFISIFVQQLISTFADKHGSIPLAKIILAMYTISCICFAVISVTDNSGLFLSLVYVILAVLTQSVRGLTNALCFRLSTESVKVNFGIGRAVGSFAFAVLSIILGKVSDNTGSNIFPISGIFVSIFMMIVLVVILLTSDTRSKATAEEKEIAEKDSFIDFFGRYKRFFLFLLGMLGFYAGHCYINNFFAQVVENVGGSTGDLGGIYAFAAMLELLPMIFYSKLEKKFETKPLLVVAGCAFAVKSLFTALAQSVGGIYFACFFQMFSFAVLIPASVSYVNSIMTEKDAVRGQAMVTITMGIALTAASLTGGFISEKLGIFAMVFTGVVTSVIGVLISVYALYGKKKNPAAAGAAKE